MFFYITTESFFSSLLRSALGKIGIFGNIVNHFGVVEENGRLALYLYRLTWLGSNMDFDVLYSRICKDEAFQARMIGYVESIISESIDKADAVIYGNSLATRLGEETHDSQ